MRRTIGLNKKNLTIFRARESEEWQYSPGKAASYVTKLPGDANTPGLFVDRYALLIWISAELILIDPFVPKYHHLHAIEIFNKELTAHICDLSEFGIPKPDLDDQIPVREFLFELSPMWVGFIPQHKLYDADQQLSNLLSGKLKLGDLKKQYIFSTIIEDFAARRGFAFYQNTINIKFRNWISHKEKNSFSYLIIFSYEIVHLHQCSEPLLYEICYAYSWAKFLSE